MSQNPHDLSLDLLRLEALRHEVFSTNEDLTNCTDEDVQDVFEYTAALALTQYQEAYQSLARRIMIANKYHKDMLIQLLDEVADTYDSLDITLDLSGFKKVLNERCKSIIIPETFRDTCISYLLSIMKPMKVAKDEHESDVYVFSFLMVTFGIDPEIRLNNSPKEGNQLLTYAIECWDTGAFVKVLLDRGASPHAFLERGTSKGHSPLYTACHVGNFDAVKLLVAAGADPKKPLPARCNHPHSTPFHAAVIMGRGKIVQYLVEGGYVDVHQKYLNVCAIYHAAENGTKKATLKIVKCLLAHGADPLEGEMNALGISVQNGNFELFEAMIKNREKKAYYQKVKSRFNSRQPVSLEYLARQGKLDGHKKILARLLELKQQFEPEILQAEISEKHIEEVRDLIASKSVATLKLRSEFLTSPAAIGFKSGNHPIHYACNMGNLPSLKILVEDLKVDVNATNRRGETALHLACANQHGDQVAFLVQAGARRDLKNAQGQTALDIAEERRSETCVAALLDESMTLASVVNGKQETVFRVLLQRATQDECKTVLNSIENRDRFALVARKLPVKKTLMDSACTAASEPVQSKPKEPSKPVIRREARPNQKTAAVQAKLSEKQSLRKKGQLRPLTEIKVEKNVVEPPIALRTQLVRVPKPPTPDPQYPTVHGLPHKALTRCAITVEPSNEHSLADTEEVSIKLPVRYPESATVQDLPPCKARIISLITVESSDEHSLVDTEEVSIKLPVSYPESATVQDLPRRARIRGLVTVESSVASPVEHSLEVILPVAQSPTQHTADLHPINIVLAVREPGLGFDPVALAVSCTYEPRDSDRIGLELFGFLQQRSPKLTNRRSPKPSDKPRRSILDPTAQPFEPPSRSHSPN